jgi:apolipoprotein N-acyltransferase
MKPTGDVIAGVAMVGAVAAGAGPFSALVERLGVDPWLSLLTPLAVLPPAGVALFFALRAVLTKHHSSPGVTTP